MNTVFLNNEYLQAENAKISIFDHGFLYADALYETILVQNGEMRFFSSHMQRMKKSLEVLKISLPEYFSSDATIQKKCEELIKQNNCNRGRLRITVTRGENGFSFSTCVNATVLMSISPLPEYDKNFYTSGVAVLTERQVSRSIPELKTTSFVASGIARQKLEEDKNIFEILFVSHEGFFREGTVSNCIFITKNKVWVSPRSHVLPGTMQEHVEEIFQKEGFLVVEKNFSFADIEHQEEGEMYITNSLFGVMPISSVNGKKLREKFPLFEKFIGSNFL